MNLQRARLIIAGVLLLGSLVGWPLAALTVAKDEPQFVLGLSFLAIIIESGTLLTAAQVHRDQDVGGSDSTQP